MLNNIFNTSLISFGLIFLCFISTHVISNPIYAEIFEFNEEDYYSSQDDDQTNSQDDDQTNSQDDDQTNSQDQSANFEDTSNQDSITSQDDDQTNSQDQSATSEDSEKENCITNQENNYIQTSTDSDGYLNNFHFIKKFDRDGNLVDSWGTVGSGNGQFLHAHGITVDNTR